MHARANWPLSRAWFKRAFSRRKNKEFHQQGSKMRESVKMYPENTAYFNIPYD